MTRRAPSTPRDVTIDVGLDDAADEASLRKRIAASLGVAETTLPEVVLRKRSLDARRGRVRFHLSYEVGASETTDFGAPHPRPVGEPRVVVVGAGPAGLFCAYELARRGVGSVVLDRGKPVQPRRRDLKGLNRRGEVDTDSNYCFGEGGAGTYSDGKLYTRAHKRGDVRDVIEILVRHGAPREIVTDARPHIGSNRLPRVVDHLRSELEAAGVVFRFGARVAALDVDGRRRATGVRLSDGSVVSGEAVVLATGHSASDVYAFLDEQGVRLEAKPFALGVRIEHPQQLIDRAQYGDAAGHPALPAAAYRLAETVEGRGVFSFCMCPGGFIVPATTEPSHVVVNGMSLSKRNSRFANSGLVVAVEPDDVRRFGFEGPRGGVELQRRIERAAFDAGGGMLRAPATRAPDFLQRKSSSDVPTTSYVPGTTPANLAEVFDACAPGFSSRLARALEVFDGRIAGYASADAVLVGVETRTSSPVRVPRHPETLESPDLISLYPAGEGAGHAGGIMSAAMDGLRIGRCIALRLGAV